MQLTFSMRIATLKRWIATVLLGIFAFAFVWQGTLISNTSAFADVGDRAEQKASSDAAETKDFIEDTKDFVKKAANDNAAKVDRATDEDSLIENKAQRDANRIEQKANKDAARTKEAVDDTKNFFESAIDNIQDTFGN
ncbi:hypothetical protein IQ255_20660 [Pleurocapsales cyanobacterium LEGE 10410]|nr:hypothetical protein [Pleurocapsales cyanobacterium LEGE 10410]